MTSHAIPMPASTGPVPATVTSQTCRDIPILSYGAEDKLKVRERPLEEVGPQDLAIAVKYSGVNFADIQMRLGFYPDAPRKPFVPGYEVSGVIEAVGSEVSRFEVGDEVMAGTFFGGYASRVVIPAYQASPIPAVTSLAEAAAIPVNFITAQVALFEMGRIREGDKVLIECATGGVGTLAVQMARHVGAEVVGLTTSPHKKSYIEALGATAYTREEFRADDAIRGFDCVVNASGGRSIKRQMKRLNLTGRIVCMGLNSGVKDGKRSVLRMARAALQMPRISVLRLFDANVGVYGLNALHIMEDERWIQRMTEGFATVDDMQLKPHIGGVFPAEEVAEAHRFLQTRQALGKVLLEW